MKNYIEQNGTTLKVMIEGRLDAATSPILEKTLEDNIKDSKDLILDMEKLDYISSAGLRVLLAAHKKMNAIGTLKLINVGDMVIEVLEMTGFADILTIE